MPADGWLQPVFVALLGAIAIVVTAINWWILWLGYRRGEHHSSAGFIGGICGAVAVGLSPWKELHPWAWVPLVLDPGCGWLAIELIWTAIRTRGFRDR